MSARAEIDLPTLRELVRLSFAAHGGFHGGAGKPIAEYAAAGCRSCAAIDQADQAVRQLEGRKEDVLLLDLQLGGKGPHP